MKNKRPALFLLLGGFAVFVFGNPFYTVFPTSGSLTYALSLSACLLLLALFFRQSPALNSCWPATYALFTAAAALAFLNTGYLDLPRAGLSPLQDLAVDKVSQLLHVVPAVLTLNLLAGFGPDVLFMRRGRWRQGLLLGLVSFGIFGTLTWLLVPESHIILSDIGAVWLVMAFIFSNSIMEELWFRGVFLRRYEALVGRSGACLITALVFGASHVNASYEFPGGGLVFGLVVAILGWIGAHAMFKQESWIGPVVFHAAYDLVIVVPVLATGS